MFRNYKYFRVSEKNTFIYSGFVLLFLLYSSEIAKAQCDIGGTVIEISSLPYSGTALSNCGAGNNLNSETVISCGSGSYLDQEEIVFVFSAPADDYYHLTLSNATENWTSMKLYDGCPLLDQGGACVDQVSGSSPEKILGVDLVQGQTYYLVISRYYEECFEFDLSIDLPQTCPEPGTNGWETISLPFAQTGLTNCGMGNDLNYYNTTSCGSNAYLNNEEIVYIFEAPASDYYHFTLSNVTQNWTSMKLYDGCPLLDQGGACVDQVSGSSPEKILGVDLVQGQTYYLVISRYYEECFEFDLSIDLPQTCPEPGTNGWETISLPFAQTGLTNCGMGNDLNYYNTTSCGSNAYLNNEEIVYIFEAPASDYYHFTLSNATQNWTSMKLYDGCPLLDQGGACVDQVSGSSPEKILGADLVQGQTYYLVISRYYEECFEFDLSIDLPQTCPEPGTNGWETISLPFAQTGLTNCGMGNDLNYYNTISCGSNAYLNNEELILIFEAPTSELYQFALTGATENWTSMKLYDGCPLLDQGGACVDQVSGSTPEKILDVDLVQGQTYYLVISRYYEECFEFDLSINTWCQVPVPIVQLPEGLCPGQEMPELTVENPVGTVNWYADANLTVHLGTGETFQPDGDFSQVVYVTNTLECESASLKVPVPVYSAPAITLLQGQEGIFLQENQIRYAQWVEKYSSQQSANNTASSVLGIPDVYPQYGNLPGAWMPENSGNEREYIVLGFPDPQPTTSLVVFETFHPGGIDTIWGFNPGIQSWEMLWAGDAFAAEEESRIFQVNFPETDFDLELVRLAINLSVFGNAPAIDAVGLMNPSYAVCQDQYITLNLPYGENILWSTGETTQSVSFMPEQSGTVTVQSELYGCNFFSSIELTLLDDVSPGPVSNMTPEDGTLNVSLTPTLNWINGENTSDVDLFFWPANEDQPTEPIISNYTGMQITLTRDKTEPNTEYKWQIISNHYLCNNTTGPVQSFFTRDLPNLQVSNLQVESNGYTGEPVQISFMVTNTGNATTGSISWKDAVFLSSGTELSLDDDVLLGVKSNPKFLLPGESYTQNMELTIPPENLGNYHIIVATNFNCQKKFIGASQVNYVIQCSNPLEESTLDDNFLVSETSIAFTLPPLPDLTIENFAAPDIAFAGDTINITYTVANAGNKLAISQNYRLAYNLCRLGDSGINVISGKSNDQADQSSTELQEINPIDSWVALMTNFCALIEPLWTDNIFLSTDNPGFLPPEAKRLGGSFIHFKRDNYQSAGYELPNEYEFNSISERIEIFERWDSVPGYLNINESYQRQLQVVLPNCIEGDQFFM
jgi:hypothetical protein